MKGFFSKLWNGFKGIFAPGSRQDIALKQTVLKVAALLEPALQAAQFVVALTPNKADDLIVSKLTFWITKARQFGVDPDAAAVAGIKLALASAELRKKLLETIKTTHAGIEFAGRILRTVEDVLGLSDTELNTAVQTGYQILKESR